MSTHDVPVQAIVDAIDSLIDDTGVEATDVGITIDRAFPHTPQELAAALVFEDVAGWPAFLARLRIVDGDSADHLSRTYQQRFADHRPAVCYFPGIRFVGPLCPYDQKEA